MKSKKQKFNLLGLVMKTLNVIKLTKGELASVQGGITLEPMKLDFDHDGGVKEFVPNGTCT